MRCSVCSEEIRPVVAVDIDGTLGDYHGHFLDFAEQYLGRGLNYNYQGIPGFRDWFAEVNNVGTEEYRAIKLAYRQGGLKRSMPVYDGAQSLLREILAHEAELWLTTTRPYLSLDTVIPDTVHWLERNAMSDYDGMLFDEDKYAQLVKRVEPERIVAVIDDLSEMCDAADKAVGRPVAILSGTEWNSAIWERSRNMWEVVAGIGPLIEKWKEKHDDD
jgi:phosphoglycolate phosphatase-like HAD superfamily hydrolase